MIFFKSVRCPENENIVDFEALENEICFGKCRLIIDGSKAEINSLFFDENKDYIGEGLIKSAFNYACLKNCYMGYLVLEKDFDLAVNLGFQKQNGIYFNDIPSILQGNCCKAKHNI